MQNSDLETAFGHYTLTRFPIQKNTSLRAWDAADEYLLAYLAQEKIISTQTNVLIINDGFGALSLSLHAYTVQNWSDSWLSQQACIENFQNNAWVTTAPQLIPSTASPKGCFDVVLIKIPKTLALLEDFLIRLKPHLHTETRIISAAMVKHLPKSTLVLLEKIVGQTTTSLAKKKARLIFTQYQNTQTYLQSPYPSSYLEKDTGLDFSHYANVFSKDKLDIGTRFMLQQFQYLPQKQHIVDLGCGNGILGIMAQKQCPNAQLSFLDESYMAVASAQDNYQQHCQGKHAHFIVGHALEQLTTPVELILCNPPFHQQHSIGDLIAWQMFTQSYQHLQVGGELWIVGNRHLNYHSKLKKIFSHCRQIAANRKFVVLAAKKV